MERTAEGPQPTGWTRAGLPRAPRDPGCRLLRLCLLLLPPPPRPNPQPLPREHRRLTPLWAPVAPGTLSCHWARTLSDFSVVPGRTGPGLTFLCGSSVLHRAGHSQKYLKLLDECVENWSRLEANGG